MIRWYLIPIEQFGNRRGPKYLVWRFGTGTLDVEWGLQDLGNARMFAVWARVTDAQHEALAAHEDVRALANAGEIGDAMREFEG